MIDLDQTIEACGLTYRARSAMIDALGIARGGGRVDDHGRVLFPLVSLDWRAHTVREVVDAGIGRVDLLRIYNVGVKISEEIVGALGLDIVEQREARKEIDAARTRIEGVLIGAFGSSSAAKLQMVTDKLAQPEKVRDLQLIGGNQ